MYIESCKLIFLVLMYCSALSWCILFEFDSCPVCGLGMLGRIAIGLA